MEEKEGVKGKSVCSDGKAAEYGSRSTVPITQERSAPGVRSSKGNDLYENGSLANHHERQRRSQSCNSSHGGDHVQQGISRDSQQRSDTAGVACNSPSHSEGSDACNALVNEATPTSESSPVMCLSDTSQGEINSAQKNTLDISNTDYKTNTLSSNASAFDENGDFSRDTDTGTEFNTSSDTINGTKEKRPIRNPILAELYGTYGIDTDFTRSVTRSATKALGGGSQSTASTHTDVSCPFCNENMSSLGHLKQHIGEQHPGDVNINIVCHMCTFIAHSAVEFTNHYSLAHQSDKMSTQSIVTNPLRETFGKDKSLSVRGFKNMIKDLKLEEVEVPGNGFCFMSSLIAALNEQGIHKPYSVLRFDIMKEVDIYYRRLLGSSAHNTPEFTSSIAKCVAFFEEGYSTDDTVDVCIGCVANAIGINLTIVQKLTPHSYTFVDYDCRRYISTCNVFLMYYTKAKSRKYLDSHYNVFLDQGYYEKNVKSVTASFIQSAADENNPGMLKAQHLSREQNQEPQKPESTSEDTLER